MTILVTTKIAKVQEFQHISDINDQEEGKGKKRNQQENGKEKIRIKKRKHKNKLMDR